jgi:hypothetical protein
VYDNEWAGRPKTEILNRYTRTPLGSQECKTAVNVVKQKCNWDSKRAIVIDQANAYVKNDKILEITTALHKYDDSPILIEDLLSHVPGIRKILEDMQIFI